MASHLKQHSITATADHTFPGGTTTFLRADGTFAAPPAQAKIEDGTSSVEVSSTNGPIIDTVNGSETQRTDTGGNVLIGKTATGQAAAGIWFNQSGQTLITRDSAVILELNRTTNDGALQNFNQDGSTEGNITVSGGTVSYNGFCGGHWSQAGSGVSVPESTERGTILSTVDELCTWKEGRFTYNGVSQKEDYYGESVVGGTYQKEFKYDNEDGEPVTDVVTATVFESTKENYVKCKISDIDEDKCVYGVFAGYDEDGDIIVHAAGVSVIRVQGPIDKGDLIQSSGVAGVGKVQSDDILRGSTIARCNMSNSGTGIVTVPCSFIKG